MENEAHLQDHSWERMLVRLSLESWKLLKTTLFRTSAKKIYSIIQNPLWKSRQISLTCPLSTRMSTTLGMKLWLRWDQTFQVSLDRKRRVCRLTMEVTILSLVYTIAKLKCLIVIEVATIFRLGHLPLFNSFRIRVIRNWALRWNSKRLLRYQLLPITMIRHQLQIR